MRITVSNVFLTLFAAVASYAADRASKLYILDRLELQSGDVVEVIPGILKWVMSWNYGINFGLFASDGIASKMILSGLAVAVSIALLIWSARHPKDGIFALAVGLVIGGAIGNAYDRQVYGAVADFLNVTCCGLVNPFAFNVADITIFLGVILLLLRPAEDG